MANTWKIAKLAINSISEICGAMCSIIIASISLFIFNEVVLRYLFNSPTIWVTETCQYLLPALCFCGAPFCLRHRGHISVDMLVNQFSYKIRLTIDAAGSIAALIFCIMLGWQGYLYWEEALRLNFTSGGIFDVPLWIPYISFPIGMLFLCLQYIVIISESSSKAFVSYRGLSA